MKPENISKLFGGINMSQNVKDRKERDIPYVIAIGKMQDTMEVIFRATTLGGKYDQINQNIF